MLKTTFGVWFIASSLMAVAQELPVAAPAATPTAAQPVAAKTNEAPPTVTLADGARPVGDAAPVEYGLPGWKGKEKEKVLAIVVLKQDLTMNFQQAVRYVKKPDEIEKLMGLFADYERIPEPPPEYDQDGYLILREYGEKTIKPLYHILLKQQRDSAVLYMTLERTRTSAAAAATGEPPAEATAPGADGNTGAAAKLKVTEKEEATVPVTIVTLWSMTASTHFRPYCRHEYAGLARGEVPAPVAALNALYPEKK